jgi:hypothetical protein
MGEPVEFICILVIYRENGVVPRGGIELSYMPLNERHFWNGGFPVYPSMYQRLTAMRRAGAAIKAAARREAGGPVG